MNLIIIFHYFSHDILMGLLEFRDPLEEMFVLRKILTVLF